MSTEEKKSDEKKTDERKPIGVQKKGGGLGGFLKILVPALLAAGASYGGTRYAKAQNAIVVVKEKEEAEHGKRHEEAPGPTLSLEPFLLSVFDAQRKPHPMKLSVAVEFNAKASGGHDEPKVYMPRIRDAVLTYLRTLSYEQATDPSHLQKMRVELLAHCKEVGAEHAAKVLVTDFVIQ